jgi:hypothetical protein
LKAFLLMIATLLVGLGAAKAQESSVLSRPTGIGGFDTTTDGAIARLLSSAGVPGGIIRVYDQCLQPSPQRFFLQGITLQQGLDSVASIDPSRKWIYRDGAIFVGQQLQSRTILGAVIRDVEISPSDTLTLSTQRLLQPAEVRDRIKVTGINEEIIHQFSGISKVRVAGTAPEQPIAAPPIHLHQVMLSDLLNSLASMSGRAVWLYEQFECGSKSWFRITWVVGGL